MIQELNNLFYKKSIEEKINKRKKLTNEVSSVFAEINSQKEKEELQEKQSEYPYFIFDPKKKDHQIERAKMISEIKERIQKNYLYKYHKNNKKRTIYIDKQEFNNFIVKLNQKKIKTKIQPNTTIRSKHTIIKCTNRI